MAQTLEQAAAGAVAERRDAAAAAAALAGRGAWNVHPDDVHQMSMQMVMLNTWRPFLDGISHPPTCILKQLLHKGIACESQRGTLI